MSKVLEAKTRNVKSHSEVNRLRRSGYIPGVIYGYKVDNIPVYVNDAELLKMIRESGRNGVLMLDIDGKKQNVVLHDIQTDRLKNQVIHIDFFAVDMSQDIESSVRVNLPEDCAGVKDGGVLQQSLHELSVTAKPDQIPDSITIDITNLQVGETVTVGDIRNQYPFTINHEDSETIASVLPPRQEEEISTGEQQESGIPDNLEGRETSEANNEEE
ncbi:50S ribosomal protein L25/general stress protein Ctc [Heyndrickxia ginsengihumi]|uniref:Large ribosomal subunit protein bL25 n=1 Tax=Heyndrickxia ginsengihumi TaxID=363870 RepID=A0A0A6V9Y6_9BACI|nr:50S ribosomal protein L25/general stress protein Ctc [Heyndrickxia ginsengihumi]KHD85025.1 50S ribosomal protein L25 [Heyndrickxia ginsengihumi]MBE6183219.1 50S ribosomal protein L25/general stress protein Ctc [Bacillus sp. (in: firmicutes)]